MTTYVVLQPANWPGATTHLCRPLIGPRHEKTGVPWVSIARSKAYGEFALVRRDEVDHDAARALVAEAQTWIAGNQRQWQVIEQRGFLVWKKPSMVRVINPSSPAGLTKNPMDDLACEQIVALEAMLEASDRLNTLDLAVAIPKRGWLVAGIARPGELLKVQPLHDIASGVHSRAAPEDAIDGTTVYFLKAGSLIGRSVNDGRTGYVSLSQVDETAWNYPPPGARRASARASQRMHTIGRRLHRLAVTLPASHEWQDTGLQPDVLATRGVILGATTKLLWKATPIPGESAGPIIEMRHVVDASLATHDRTFTYSAPNDDRRVIASGEVVRVEGASVRFPREPGRIEVRIAGADGMRDITEIAGTLRLELLAPIAGEGDAPLHAPDKRTLESDDNFSPLPALPPNDPPAWREFRAS